MPADAPRRFLIDDPAPLLRVISTRGATLSLVGDPDDFDGILEKIRERVKERTPKRATHQWLKFEDANGAMLRFAVQPTENTRDAMEFARDKLRPIVFEGKSFVPLHAERSTCDAL